MIETLFSFLPLCGFAVFFAAIPITFVVVVFFLVRSGRKRTVALHEAWKDFGRRAGLTFNEGTIFTYPTLTGDYRHRPVTIGIITIMHKGPNLHYTRASTPIALPPEMVLQVSDHAQTGWYYRTIDAPEIELGSPEFRLKYGVRGTAPELAQAVLTDRVQSAMLANGFSHLTLADNLLTVRVRGFESRGPVFEAVLDLIGEIASASEAGAPASKDEG